MSAQSFVQPPQGRFAIGCAAFFIALPVIGSTLALLGERSILTPIPGLLGAVLLGAAYYVFNEEVRIDLDDRSMRFSRARLIVGMRIASRVEWEIPTASLTHAKEVRRKTPANRGGWNHSTVLQLPAGRALDARELGGSEDHASPYNELVRVLEKRLGAAFERPPEIV